MAWVRTPAGGRPFYGRGSIGIACPICDAAVGNHCVAWRMWAGERHSVLRVLQKPHAERVRLWKLRTTTPATAVTAVNPLPGLTTPPPTSATDAPSPGDGPHSGGLTS